MSSTPSVSQLEYWNGPAAQKWITSRERLDESLVSITQATMDRAAPRAGERVLDVGCGCGTTSFLLHDRVAPGGTVLGVDISGPMLAVARERAAATSGVDFLEADAGAHRFAREFDLVFSRYGLMFFDDPVDAFTRLRGAMTPGARMAFVCWRAMPENPWVTVPLVAVRDLLPPSPPADPHAPGPFAFADKDRLRGILAAAGFAEIQIDSHDDAMWLGSTAEDAAAHALSVGPLSRAASELPEPVRQEISSRVVGALAPHVGPRGVALGAAVWLVSCR